MSGGSFTLVIRNAYLSDKDSTYDIGICGERIKAISTKIPEKGDAEIDAREKLVSPGFVDSHTHMDKAFTACGERRPKYNDSVFDIENSIRAGLEYFKNASFDEIKSHAIEHAYLQVLHGTLYTRTHVDVDRVARTKGIEAVLEAREELKELIDIQVVAFAQSGFLRDPESEFLVKKAIEMGAELVGTVDPACRECDIEKSLDLGFQIARDFDVDIDHHLHERGTLGNYTLKRFAQKGIDHKYEGKITSSHSFSLADADQKWLDEMLPLFKKAGLRFVTCYSSSPYSFPVKKLFEAGIPIACASDNTRDFWMPTGNGDMLEGALIETQRFNMRSNPELDLIWQMITEEGAKVLGIEKDYGIEVGKKADLVILDALSPPWAIIEQARRLYVIKNGRVVAKDGEVLV